MDHKTRRHQALRRLYEAAERDNAVERFKQDFQETLASEGPGLADRYSVRHLFENFVENGREAIQFLRPASMGGYVNFQESAGLVDTANFANIMGQITYTATLNGYNMPGLIGDQLVETIQTDFSGERIPGVGRLGDDVEVVREGEPYPNAQFGEEYVDTPETIKRGVIVNITREALFFDRTGLILSEAGKMGNRVSVNREKRILDVVLGISTVYRRNGAAAQATYASDNSVSNTLSDWSNLDVALQKFNDMTDPVTGEPIAMNPNLLVVPKRLENTAKRIMNATMVRVGTNTAANQTYTNGNQVEGPYQVISSPYVKARSGSDTTWWLGDFKQGFVYMQNWPLSVLQEGSNTEVGFTRDVIARYRVTERGAAAVRERLCAVRNT